MTSDHDALVRAICENPRDDAPRLVFADWLQEHGEPPHSTGRAGSTGAEWGAERAEFIRFDIAMSLRDEWDLERLRWEDRLTPGSVGLLDQPWMAAARLPLPGNWTWTGTPVTRRGFAWSAEIRDPRTAFAHTESLANSTIDQLHFPWVRPDFHRLAGLRGASRLRSLSFRASRFGARDLARLVTGLLPGIEALAFHYQAITATGVDELLHSPLGNNLTHLRFTHLGNSRVGCGILESLAANPLPRLLMLGLRVSLFGGNGTDLITGGAIPPTVRILDLSGNHFDSDRTQTLAHAPGLANLKSLSLSENQTGNAGAAALFRSPHLAGLKVLDLSYSMVGDDALRALLDDSPLADGLNRLDLRGSPASADMKQAVKDRMGERVRLSAGSGR